MPSVMFPPATVENYCYELRAKEAVPQCPVCGTANPSLRATARWNIFVGVSQCRCSLGYLNPRLTAAEYADFYTSWYRPLVEAHRPPSRRATPRLANVWCYGDAIGRLIRPYIMPGGALLDVGGSNGRVAAEVARHVQAETVMIIDPNPAELADAATLGYQTRLGTGEDPLPRGECYQGILCARTIDHVREPVPMLRSLRAALAPGGWLWIDFVDAARLRAAWPLSAWRIDHPLYWSVTSLKAALAQTGWVVVQHWRAHDISHHVGFLCQGA